MYYIMAILAGVFISVMILINGELTGVFGIYSATTIIHIVGLICVSLLVIAKKENLRPKEKLPAIVFFGGCVGFFTTVFNNIAFGKISISAILALGLLGQSLSSLFIDQTGLLGMPIKKFKLTKLIGVVFVTLGILCMISFDDKATVIPIIVSVLTGFTIVFARTLNAKLTASTSYITSAWYNYVVGLLTSIVFLFILGRGEAAFIDFEFSSKIWIYTGGLVGLMVVMFLNIAVAKIPSFYMSLALFVGQVFMGVILDAIISHKFSSDIFVGGLFVAVGLIIDLLLERREKLLAT